MASIIRLGDKLSSGGYVMAASSEMIIRGKGAARLGDPVYCPLEGHGHNFIAQGHPNRQCRGIPLAFNGYLCACGCTLISSLPNFSIS